MYAYVCVCVFGLRVRESDRQRQIERETFWDWEKVKKDDRKGKSLYKWFKRKSNNDGWDARKVRQKKKRVEIMWCRNVWRKFWLSSYLYFFFCLSISFLLSLRSKSVGQRYWCQLPVHLIYWFRRSLQQPRFQLSLLNSFFLSFSFSWHTH